MVSLVLINILDKYVLVQSQIVYLLHFKRFSWKQLVSKLIMTLHQAKLV